MGTCQKVAVVPTPASHGSMPEHIGLGPIGGRFRADNFRARSVSDVNVSDVPGNGSFLHRGSRLRLNDRESVDSASETVRGGGTGLGASPIVPAGRREQDTRRPGKGRLATPDG